MLPFSNLTPCSALQFGPCTLQSDLLTKFQMSFKLVLNYQRSILKAEIILGHEPTTWSTTKKPTSMMLFT